MKSPSSQYASAETPSVPLEAQLRSPSAMLRSHEYLSEGEMESRMRELASDAENNGTPYAFDADAEAEKERTRSRPRPEVTLRTGRFSALVLLSVGLIAGVTAVFWWGIEVNHVNEPVGSSERSERQVDRFNTYSGVIMGIVETFIGLGLGNFFPVFTVYVHNLKWFPGDDPAVRTSKLKKVGVLVFFPLLMVAFGNSFTALQAGSYSATPDLLLAPADLNASATSDTDTSSLVAGLAADTTRTLPLAVQKIEDTILRTAIERRATPFTYPTDSTCDKQLSEYGAEIMMRLSAIDSTNLLLGFPVKDWAAEVYPEAPLVVSDAALGLQTSFELAFQGQAMMQRTLGDVKTRYDCAETSSSSSGTGSTGSSGEDASLQCYYIPVTYLPTLQEFVNGTATQSAAALDDAIFQGVANVFAYYNGESALNRSTLSVTSQSFNLSSNVQTQVLSVRVEFNRGQVDEYVTYSELLPSGDYRYNLTYSDTACSAAGCVLLDWSNTVQPIPRQQALMTRYMSSCPADSIAFSFDAGAEVPFDCEYESDAAFVYGHGSRLVGDEFGLRADPDDSQYATPYVLNARRELFFTFARVNWAFEDLSAKFGATCRAGNCHGLSHNLSASSRYVVLGNDSVPARLRDADFLRPAKLFELSAPLLKYSIYSSAALLRIDPSNFERFDTSGRELAGAECSVIAEAYMAQVEANHYWMEDPLQASLSAALLFLYQAGAVTSVFQETIADSAFGKMAMSEDMILSTIYISNTNVGAAALWVGCGIVLLLAAVALLFPNERARLAPPEGSNMRAERFIGVQTEELYPNLVYKKRFLVGEEIKFREFAVESVTLHHKMEEEAHVRL